MTTSQGHCLVNRLSCKRHAADYSAFYLIKVGMDQKLVAIFGGIKFHLPAILAFTRVLFGFDPYHTQVIICRLNNTPHASLELHKEG